MPNFRPAPKLPEILLLIAVLFGPLAFGAVEPWSLAILETILLSAAIAVLFVAVLFGISLAMVGDAGKPVLNFLEALTAPVFKLVGILMKAAPLGALRISQP